MTAGSRGGGAQGRARHAAAWAAVVAAIVILSLSVHVVMLQVLDVPYPDTSRVGRWGMLFPLAQAAGLVWLAAAVQDRLRGIGAFGRWLIVAALFVAMNGVLRLALMEGVTTTSALAPLGPLAAQLAHHLLLSGLAVALVAASPAPMIRIIGAAALAAVTLFLFPRLVGPVLGPVLAWAAAHAHPVVYEPPYGATVLVPSYLSFAETVIGCLVARWLVTLRSLAWDRSGLLRFAMLVLLVRGTIVVMVAFGPSAGPDVATGLLSVSQFFLQDIVLILLVQLAFVRMGGRRRG